MEMKIIWAAVAAFGGWLSFYLFGRQFLFNIKVAYPMIKKMLEAKDALIAGSSNQYTTVSCITTGVICVICWGLIMWLCPLYLKICFAAGFIICLCMIYGGISPDKREIFDSFCSSYYRFVPDDELRTAMYNKKPSQMKLRLHDMNVSTAFIPEFKKDK